MSSKRKPRTKERNPIVALAAVVIAVCLICSSVFPEDAGVAMSVVAAVALLCAVLPAFAVLDYVALELLRAAMFGKSTAFGRVIAIAACSALAAASILALRLAIDAGDAGVIDFAWLLAIIVTWTLSLTFSIFLLLTEIDLEEDGEEPCAAARWAAWTAQIGAGKKMDGGDSDGRD